MQHEEDKSHNHQAILLSDMLILPLAYAGCSFRGILPESAGNSRRGKSSTRPSDVEDCAPQRRAFSLLRCVDRVVCLFSSYQSLSIKVHLQQRQGHAVQCKFASRKPAPAFPPICCSYRIAVRPSCLSKSLWHIQTITLGAQDAWKWSDFPAPHMHFQDGGNLGSQSMVTFLPSFADLLIYRSDVVFIFLRVRR